MGIKNKKFNTRAKICKKTVSQENSSNTQTS